MTLSLVLLNKECRMTIRHACQNPSMQLRHCLNSISTRLHPKIQVIAIIKVVQWILTLQLHASQMEISAQAKSGILFFTIQQLYHKSIMSSMFKEDMTTRCKDCNLMGLTLMFQLIYSHTKPLKMILSLLNTLNISFSFYLMFKTRIWPT